MAPGTYVIIMCVATLVTAADMTNKAPDPPCVCIYIQKSANSLGCQSSVLSGLRQAPFPVLLLCAAGFWACKLPERFLFPPAIFLQSDYRCVLP